MQSQHTLELRQRQQLAMTPELQQSIRFLQLSAMELHQELAQAVLDNPMLESEAEYDIDDELAVGADVPVLTVDWSGRSRSRTGRDIEDGDEFQAVAPETLREYLLQQLSMARAGSLDQALVQVLVHELDQDGYLLTPLHEIVAYLQQHVNVQLADAHSALCVLQSLEPAGVGARSLAECLTLQLDRLQQDGAGEHDPDVWDCARQIARDHLDLLATGNLNRLRLALGCDAELLKAAHGLIMSLEPRPTRDWAGAVADYVVPDVFVRKVDSRWQVVLNPASMPRVRVHRLYSALLATAGQSHPDLRDQLQRAQGLVRNLHHRGDTILRVSRAIMDQQADYLEQGVGAMRPLGLRAIADMLDIHESTVSRATRFKYAQTPHGVIELRAFFSSALDTDEGEATSASAVQFMIARLVEQESQTKPLSDSKIAGLLVQDGIRIARRTVAKYREAAGIEPAIRRKARYSLQARQDDATF